MRPNWQTRALALAAKLDAMLAAEPDYLAEDALHEIGALTGGLGADGFAADVRGWIEHQVEKLSDDPVDSPTEADRFNEAEAWARQWFEDASALVEKFKRERVLGEAA